jgi:hypothetical protein
LRGGPRIPRFEGVDFDLALIETLIVKQGISLKRLL